MDLLSTVRKSGSRGGVNFSWDEVANSAHRENYLGHSLKAPVGRWQKGRDLTWYAKADDTAADSNETEEERRARERREEIRRIKEAEEDAMSRALGLPVAPRNTTGANAVEVSGSRMAGLPPETAVDENKELKGGLQDHIVTITITIITGADIAAEIAVEIGVVVGKDGEIGRQEECQEIQSRGLLATTGGEEAAVGTTSGVREKTSVTEAGAVNRAATDSAVGAETGIGADLLREGGVQAQDSLDGELISQKAPEVEDWAHGKPKRSLRPISTRQDRWTQHDQRSQQSNVLYGG